MLGSLALLLLVPVWLAQDAQSALSIKHHYDGCYGADDMIRKIPEYRPSADCFRRCLKDGKSPVIVSGGIWCGCTSEEGELGGADHFCPWKCKAISSPRCECYQSGTKTYNEAARDLAYGFMLDLPKPNEIKGYNCHQIEVGLIAPKPLKERSNWCINTRCHMTGKKEYGAYLSPVSCGCKRNDNPADDTLLPITPGCVDKMVCVEEPRQACLCGNELVSANRYAGANRIGPLFKTDVHECRNFDKSRKDKRETLLFPNVVLNLTTPETCITRCGSNGKKYAAMISGKKCACQNSLLKGYYKFTDKDCDMLCALDGSTPCGGPYTAAVYTTTRKTDAALLELERLVGKKVAPVKEEGHKRPEYEGCYGVNVLVRKLPEFRPSGSCFRRCQQEGFKSVIVGGGLWCGCPSTSGLRGVDGKCASELGCRPIPSPICECFRGDKSTYDDTADTKVYDSLALLPGQNTVSGFDCPTNPTPSFVGPGSVDGKSEWCVNTMCHKQVGRKYGAMLSGYRCGCKMTDDPDDDTLLPVNPDCVDKMVCVQAAVTACLCGTEELSANSYSFMDRVGPLFKPDHVVCFKTYIDDKVKAGRLSPHFKTTNALIKHSTPARCVSRCASANYSHAGIHNGGECMCENTPGKNVFTDADCKTPCKDGSEGCGGVYTVSVYSTAKKQVVNIDDLAKLLENKLGGNKPVESGLDGLGEDFSEGVNIKVEGEKEFETEEEVPVVVDEGINTLVLTMSGIALAAVILGLITLCCFIRMRKNSTDGKKPSKTEIANKLEGGDKEAVDEDEEKRRKEEKRRRKQEKREKKEKEAQQNSEN